MLSRFIRKASHFRLLSIAYSKSPSCSRPPVPSSRQGTPFTSLLRHFSSNHGNNGNGPLSSDPWKLSEDTDGKFDRFFGAESGDLGGIDGIEKDTGENAADGAADDWLTAEGYEPWSLREEEKQDVFDLGQDTGAIGEAASGGSSVEPVQKQLSEEELRMLEKEERELTAVIKGPNRAFGDLIAVSGITDDMLDSLIALKDFEGIEGLPSLRDIEDLRYEKSLRKSTRAEIERQKQEEIAKSRVRKVDEKGRAYGTGRRKCSIARVWIQPGDGKFSVNEKEIDVYFPMLDHRAALLRPFSETKTLGLWDVNCTVKGGGMSGQVGAIRLGISRALQNWEPDLHSPLRSAGFLTRDPRVVERKKPGKAKARKSYQWVKR